MKKLKLNLPLLLIVLTTLTACVTSKVPPRSAEMPEVGTITSFEPWRISESGCPLGGNQCNDNFRLRVGNNETSLRFRTINPLTDTDSRNANFKIVEGLGNKSCVSFESLALPNRYIKHNGEEREVTLSGRFEFFINDAATFCGDNHESLDLPGFTK